MSFQDDLELSHKAEPLIDNIYQLVFPDCKITRTQGNILDRQYHIDVVIELSNKTKLIGQEKVLRNKFIEYNTFTVECLQNRFTLEQGELFNLGTQFYFHGYWNSEETDIEKWYLFKTFDFLMWLTKYSYEEIIKNHTKPSSSNASFFWINYNNIPDNIIYASFVKKTLRKLA